ncbi:MAG: alkylmercury lyase MerB [Vicinamibacterales bacterium]
MHEARFNAAETAAALVELFPALGREEQRLSLELYRLLAEGQPASIRRLAERLGHAAEDVAYTLRKWPGVFFNEQGDVIGYWGLSPTHETTHRLKTDGRTLYAWCAWDTLFLPTLLGRSVDVESISPKTLTLVRLTVTPNGVRSVEPQGVVMSFLMPDGDKVQQDVLTSFCHLLHFFASKPEGESWVADHPGTRLLTLVEAFELGRQRKSLQYPDFVP